MRIEHATINTPGFEFSISPQRLRRRGFRTWCSASKKQKNILDKFHFLYFIVSNMSGTSLEALEAVCNVDGDSVAQESQRPCPSNHTTVCPCSTNLESSSNQVICFDTMVRPENHAMLVEIVQNFSEAKAGMKFSPVSYGFRVLRHRIILLIVIDNRCSNSVPTTSKISRIVS